VPGPSVCYRVRGAVDDVALSGLHDAAFGEPGPVQPWNARLHHHSLSWVEAYVLAPGAGARLVGFVNVVWDGGVHAFLLDTCVDPGHQRAGVGLALVQRAVDAAREAGCTWLHVDFEPRLEAFYARCGFSVTIGGLRRLVLA
jgi:GNAT superfamily N-acetyltransferase